VSVFFREREREKRIDQKKRAGWFSRLVMEI